MGNSDRGKYAKGNTEVPESMEAGGGGQSSSGGSGWKVATIVLALVCLVLLAVLVVGAVMFLPSECEADGSTSEARVGEKGGCTFLVSDWASYSISALNTQGPTTEQLLGDLYQPHDLAFDPNLEVIFWTQCWQQDPPFVNEVNKASLTDPQLTSVTTDIFCPVGVAVAPRDKYLFVASSKTSIFRMNYTGGDREAIIPDDVGEVWGMAADDVTQTLFWTDQNNKLESASYVAISLNRRILYQEGGDVFTGLTLDSVGGVLYWSNIIGKIMSMRIDGGTAEVVKEGDPSERVAGIAFCENRLYYTEWESKRTVLSLPSDGGEAEKVSDFREPIGILAIKAA